LFGSWAKQLVVTMQVTFTARQLHWCHWQLLQMVLLFVPSICGSVCGIDCHA
jgi:hypothetical protein